MSKLKKELGMSILFITHDLGLVKEFSDQVCVMQDGKIVEQGNTSTVFENPSHPYTQKLLNAEPQPKENINGELNPLIEIDGLNVFYTMPSINFLKKNRFHAVKDVSLNIYKNTTIGLVGESGSGKSTLGKAIANLINFDGKIAFNGQEIAKSLEEALNLNKKNISAQKERARKRILNEYSIKKMSLLYNNIYKELL